MAITHDAPILITGAGGFIGRNLTARLRALGYTQLLLFDTDTPHEHLVQYAACAQFVYHLAGVNRPQTTAEFYSGNTSLTENLMQLLQAGGNRPGVVLTSSAQVGNGSDYGTSKQQAEQAVFAYAAQTGAKAFVYRLPGVFGKWSRPNYNSVVATFCHNIAHGLPIEIRDESFALPLCYIDDVVNSFVANLDAAVFPPANDTMGIHPVYTVTLGQIAELLQSFQQSRQTLAVPNMADGFAKKLYATYLAYLPEDAFAYPLKANRDERGSFTEILRTEDRGQVSVNIAHPGITKGNHWHDTKNEKFIVVSGQGVVRFRKVGSAEVLEYFVNGDEPTVVDIPTGYTHNIENVGESDLVTVMWANESFDPANPDTYFEKV